MDVKRKTSYKLGNEKRPEETVVRVKIQKY